MVRALGCLPVGCRIGSRGSYAIADQSRRPIEATRLSRLADRNARQLQHANEANNELVNMSTWNRKIDGIISRENAGIALRRQRLQNAGRMIKLIVRIGRIQLALFAI